MRTPQYKLDRGTPKVPRFLFKIKIYKKPEINDFENIYFCKINKIRNV